MASSIDPTGHRVIAIVGGPGSGKSSFGRWIEQHYGHRHISTGSIFRSLPSTLSNPGLVLSALRLAILRSDPGSTIVVDGIRDLHTFEDAMNKLQPSNTGGRISISLVIEMRCPVTTMVSRMQLRGPNDEGATAIHTRVASSLGRRVYSPRTNHHTTVCVNSEAPIDEYVHQEGVAAAIAEHGARRASSAASTDTPNAPNAEHGAATTGREPSLRHRTANALDDGDGIQQDAAEQPPAQTDTTKPQKEAARAKLGIYFGSFDPVHENHVAVARHALNHHGFDKVVFVANPSVPQKPSLSPLDEREALLRVRLGSEPGIAVYAHSSSATQLDLHGRRVTCSNICRVYRARCGANIEIEVVQLIGADKFKAWQQAAGSDNTTGHPPLFGMVSGLTTVVVPKPTQRTPHLLCKIRHNPPFGSEILEDVEDGPFQGTSKGTHIVSRNGISTRHSKMHGTRQHRYAAVRVDALYGVDDAATTFEVETFSEAPISVLVFPRHTASLEEAPPTSNSRVVFATDYVDPTPGCSSTTLRRALRLSNTLSEAAATPGLHPTVLASICTAGSYGSPCTVDPAVLSSQFMQLFAESSEGLQLILVAVSQSGADPASSAGRLQRQDRLRVLARATGAKFKALDVANEADRLAASIKLPFAGDSTTLVDNFNASVYRQFELFLQSTIESGFNGGLIVEYDVPSCDVDAVCSLLHQLGIRLAMVVLDSVPLGYYGGHDDADWGRDPLSRSSKDRSHQLNTKTTSSPVGGLSCCSSCGGSLKEKEDRSQRVKDVNDLFGVSSIKAASPTHISCTSCKNVLPREFFCQIELYRQSTIESGFRKDPEDAKCNQCRVSRRDRLSRLSEQFSRMFTCEECATFTQLAAKLHQHGSLGASGGSNTKLGLLIFGQDGLEVMAAERQGEETRQAHAAQNTLASKLTPYREWIALRAVLYRSGITGDIARLTQQWARTGKLVIRKNGDISCQFAEMHGLLGIAASNVLLQSMSVAVGVPLMFAAPAPTTAIATIDAAGSIEVDHVKLDAALHARIGPCVDRIELTEPDGSFADEDDTRGHEPSWLSTERYMFSCVPKPWVNDGYILMSHDDRWFVRDRLGSWDTIDTTGMDWPGPGTVMTGYFHTPVALSDEELQLEIESCLEEFSMSKDAKGVRQSLKEWGATDVKVHKTFLTNLLNAATPFNKSHQDLLREIVGKDISGSTFSVVCLELLELISNTIVDTTKHNHTQSRSWRLAQLIAAGIDADPDVAVAIKSLTDKKSQDILTGDRALKLCLDICAAVKELQNEARMVQMFTGLNISLSQLVSPADAKCVPDLTDRAGLAVLLSIGTACNDTAPVNPKCDGLDGAGAEPLCPTGADAASGSAAEDAVSAHDALGPHGRHNPLDDQKRQLPIDEPKPVDTEPRSATPSLPVLGSAPRDAVKRCFVCTDILSSSHCRLWEKTLTARMKAIEEMGLPDHDGTVTVLEHLVVKLLPQSIGSGCNCQLPGSKNRQGKCCHVFTPRIEYQFGPSAMMYITICTESSIGGYGGGYGGYGGYGGHGGVGGGDWRLVATGDRDDFRDNFGLPGGWLCPSCNTPNFASRTKCARRRCGKIRPAGNNVEDSSSGSVPIASLSNDELHQRLQKIGVDKVVSVKNRAVIEATVGRNEADVAKAEEETKATAGCDSAASGPSFHHPVRSSDVDFAVLHREIQALVALGDVEKNVDAATGLEIYNYRVGSVDVVPHYVCGHDETTPAVHGDDFARHGADLDHRDECTVCGCQNEVDPESAERLCFCDTCHIEGCSNVTSSIQYVWQSFKENSDKAPKIQRRDQKDPVCDVATITPDCEEGERRPKWVASVSDWCRGLVLDPVSRSVVTTPFVRFAANGSTETLHQQVTASVKLDGSLAIAFMWQGKLCVTTRRRMTSEQALWASDWLSSNSNTDKFEDGWTYLFEVLGRDNIVATACATDGLVLLAVFDKNGFELERACQEEVAAELNVRNAFQFEGTIDDFHLFCSENHRSLPRRHGVLHLPTIEGWVIKLPDGSRLKMVTDAWRRSYAAAKGCHPARIWQALCAGKSKERIMTIPIELRAEASSIEFAIVAQIAMDRSAANNVVDITFGPQVLVDAVDLSCSALAYAWLDGCGWCPLSLMSDVHEVLDHHHFERLQETSLVLGDAFRLDTLYSSRPSSPFRDMAFYEPSPRFAQTFCKGWDEFEFPTTDAFFGRNCGIPFEVIMNVFSSLDGRTMAHARCVAQSWRLLLNQNCAAQIARATEDARRRKAAREERDELRREREMERARRERARRDPDYFSGYGSGY